MANRIIFQAGISANDLSLAGLLKSVQALRPDVTVEHLAMQRPVLFDLLLDHILDDGSFDPEYVTADMLRHFYSFIPMEEGLKPSQLKEMRLIFDKTVELGLMFDDYTWKPSTCKTQIALWVDEMCSRFGIPYKWKWAQLRFGLKNLKQARSNTINGWGRAHGQELVIACFDIQK